jgi:tRNA U34 5-methylaminomethyl-2-thiouridine-forming methyltransferase MnmC
MEIEIITTADGSKTIHFPEWNESYHSKHGALQEAKHVYIKSGLAFRFNQFSQNPINLLEIGFGTGLNTMLSLLFAKQNGIQIHYHSLDKYPLEISSVKDLNYNTLFPDEADLFQKLHEVEWETQIEINSQFSLKKLKSDLKSFQSEPFYDLIYFDAFGPRVQPELWAKPILKKMFDALKPNGIWVTYSCKGQVKRDLMDIGFLVEKIPGPPGKREMLRAIKH